MAIQFIRKYAALLALFLFAAAAGGTAAEAWILTEHSLVCGKESSLRQALRDGTSESGDAGALRRDCGFGGTPLKVERLSCSGFICKVRIMDPAMGDGKGTIAYTLRRYLP